MKVKHTIRKYRFLLGKKTSDMVVTSRKRLASTFQNVNPSNLTPLEVEKLPYPVDWRKWYQYETLNVEIGTGHGELIEFLSQDEKNLNVGFEITKTYSLLSSKEVEGAKNSMVFKGDGYGDLLGLFRKNQIDHIYILFPDPWHKKRHHKRRPITTEWLRTINKKIKPGGFIYFATDWTEYYQFVDEQIGDLQRNTNLYLVERGIYSPETSGLVSTHYYKKWVSQNRSFKFIKLIKK